MNHQKCIAGVISLIIAGFVTTAVAAPNPGIACFKITKRAEQKIQRLTDNAALKDCRINLKADAAIAACDGDMACIDAVDAKFEPKWTRNTTRFFNAVNNTIANATAKLDAVEGDCDVDLSTLPAPYADVMAAGDAIDKAAAECNGVAD